MPQAYMQDMHLPSRMEPQALAMLQGTFKALQRTCVQEQETRLATACYMQDIAKENATLKKKMMESQERTTIALEAITVTNLSVKEDPNAQNYE